jgi:farnesyl diphosphate synthase
LPIPNNLLSETGTPAHRASFGEQITTWQSRIEADLRRRLPPVDTVPRRLHEALHYSVLGGGKRVRPMLVYATAVALGLRLEQVDAAASAVELIHAYSLVHDDLPAMDDDDLRRGRPTCHKAFDEATAILVGDALQVLAFQILAEDRDLPADAALRLRLVAILAHASGTAGMAGGQALDLAAQGRTLTLAEIEEMHARKTGALIRASVMMSAACAPQISADSERALERYATDLGLAFQIQDDLLDIEGDPKVTGKATGADEARDKPTYPAVAGLETARDKARVLHGSARHAAASLGPRAEPLCALADWLVNRES